MPKPTIGFAMCGSFCTFRKTIDVLRTLAVQYHIIPILSGASYETDSRFGAAADFRAEIEAICGEPVFHTLPEVEPFEPKATLDLLVIAPCTGNTLAKLAHGITDGAVTMAAKGHLRNGKPVVLAIATNDGLSASAPNIAVLLNRKNYYFVPFGQDNAEAKPTSLIADFRKIIPTAEASLEGRQIQPILL